MQALSRIGTLLTRAGVFSLWVGLLLVSVVLLFGCAAQKPPLTTPPGPGSGPGSCSLGQEWCQGRCLDSTSFLNDTGNCGRCGNRCSMFETCTGGSCECATGYERCMGRCVNTATFMSDAQNCGRCGNFCAVGESCLGGSCRKL